MVFERHRERMSSLDVVQTLLDMLPHALAVSIPCGTIEPIAIYKMDSWDAWCKTV